MLDPGADVPVQAVLNWSMCEFFLAIFGSKGLIVCLEIFPLFCYKIVFV